MVGRRKVISQNLLEMILPAVLLIKSHSVCLLKEVSGTLSVEAVEKLPSVITHEQGKERVNPWDFFRNLNGVSVWRRQLSCSFDNMSNL